MGRIVKRWTVAATAGALVGGIAIGMVGVADAQTFTICWFDDNENDQPDEGDSYWDIPEDGTEEDCAAEGGEVVDGEEDPVDTTTTTRTTTTAPAGAEEPGGDQTSDPSSGQTSNGSSASQAAPVDAEPDFTG